jgi:hypothetical protein
MEEGMANSLKETVEVTQELLTLLRGINEKLSKEKGSEQPGGIKGRGDRFRWYEHTLRGLNWITMPGESEWNAFICTDPCP